MNYAELYQKYKDAVIKARVAIITNSPNADERTKEVKRLDALLKQMEAAVPRWSGPPNVGNYTPDAL